jgi:hypothetical protein
MERPLILSPNQLRRIRRQLVKSGRFPNAVRVIDARLKQQAFLLDYAGRRRLGI